MVDFDTPEELVLVGDNLIRFVESEVVSLESQNAELLSSERNIYEENGRFVPEILALRKQVRMKSAEAGFYTMLAPAELGGGGLGTLASVYLLELIGAVYGPGRLLIHPVVLPSTFTNGVSPLLEYLEPEVRDRYLPDIASGEKSLCFALSEPDAGSDALAIKTRAVRDGDAWVINGTKQWITNSPYADYAMLFAVTDPDAVAARKGGITAFFIDTATPGFDVTSIVRFMGQQGGDTGIISLQDVRVPDNHRLGDVGLGLSVAMHGINTGRLGMAAGCLGFARWALDQAVAYAKTRKTFGKPIGEHQAVQLLLAESAMDIYAAKNMILNCAWRVEKSLPSRKEISMVKAYATEMLNRVMDRCMQVHGAMGLTNELRLEAGYRFARIMRIPDGTGEIQRRTIARELLYGDDSL
ncbi:MAG: acyl-CoA dehydrogenase family protein [Alphaproteobacteria bacterium]